MIDTKLTLPEPPEGMFWRLKARGENVLIELRYSKRRLLGPREYGWRMSSPRATHVEVQAEALLHSFTEHRGNRNAAQALAGNYPKPVPPPVPPRPPTTRTRNL